jgi:hypothetical protein
MEEELKDELHAVGSDAEINGKMWTRLFFEASVV